MEHFSVQYDTQQAKGFEEIYDLGQVRAIANVRAAVLKGDFVSLKLDQLEQQALAEARQVLIESQERIPNYTDDDDRFCAAFAGGYIVAFLAEQDEYQTDSQEYRQSLLSESPEYQLPQGRVIDAD